MSAAEDEFEYIVRYEADGEDGEQFESFETVIVEADSMDAAREQFEENGTHVEYWTFDITSIERAENADTPD